MTRMVIANGVRYSVEDAVRLGLVTDDLKVFTVRSQVERERDGDQDPAPLSSEATVSEGAKVVDADKRPGSKGTKDEWIAYAIAQGHAATDLDGLKRDDIVGLFADGAE